MVIQKLTAELRIEHSFPIPGVLSTVLRIIPSLTIHKCPYMNVWMSKNIEFQPLVLVLLK